MIPNPLLLPEIRLMLAEDDRAGLAALFDTLHPASLAEFAEGLSPEETWRLLDAAPAERQANVFSFFTPAKQAELAQIADRQRMSRLLEKMSHDDRVDLLQRLGPESAEQLLPLVAKADREDIRRLLSYPEGTAGSVMTTDYVTLPPDVTIETALSLIRRQASERETIYYLYVVDSQRRLIGFLSLRDLVLARPTAKVEDVMRREVVSVPVDADREHVAHTLMHYDFLALPVVDTEERLVGIVTFDDVADIAEAEATEDFHLAAAVAPSVRGYHESGLWPLYRRRIGWLIALVFVNLVSSGVIAAYEETLQAAIALAFFLPLLIDSGGNTGSQAATLIIRALATHEVKLSEWLQTVGKEIGVGLALGGTMATASLLLGWFRGGFEVGLIVAVSMLCIVLATNLIGILLPFVLTRLRLDPAVASSPLITTVADALGLLIYFNVATRILSTVGE
jgi:magnesium transporter